MASCLVSLPGVAKISKCSLGYKSLLLLQAYAKASVESDAYILGDGYHGVLKGLS